MFQVDLRRSILPTTRETSWSLKKILLLSPILNDFVCCRFLKQVFLKSYRWPLTELDKISNLQIQIPLFIILLCSEYGSIKWWCHHLQLLSNENFQLPSLKSKCCYENLFSLFWKSLCKKPPLSLLFQCLWNCSC